MKPFRLGLTGSLGMGKSTTAAFFREAGVPVWDADQAVHRLYSQSGAAVAALSELFPEALDGGVISRAALKDIIARDPSALARIESVVHPLVAQDRLEFISAADADITVLDIPLLFEKGYQSEMDATLLVTAPADLQRARVLARSGMTEDLFRQLLSRQMPDREKRGHATHIIETLGMEAARQAVLALIAYIRETRTHA